MQLPKRIYHGPEVRRLYEDLVELEVSSGGGGTSDHGALTGLGDDDHPQYIRADGTRPFTGNQSMGGNKLTGLGAATANGQAVRYEQLSSLSIYDGRVVPAGLHAHSDEFQVDTVNGGSPTWTTFDHAAYVTTTVNTTLKHVRFTSSPGGAATRHMSIYKAVPSNDFTFLAFVANDGFSNANMPAVGLLVMQGTSNTDDLYTIDLVPRRQGAAGAISTRLCTAYNVAGTITSRNYEGPTHAWLRMRVIGIGGGTTSVEADWSSDGVYWTLMQAQNLTYDVTHYGIYYFNGAAQSAQCIAKHFRVFDGVTGPYDSINGGYLVG